MYCRIETRFVMDAIVNAVNSMFKNKDRKYYESELQ